MEWAIPLQKLELGKVQIGNIKNNEKLMVPLAYFDGINTFNNLNILLPKLKVQEFNDKTGKLVLSFKEHKQFEAKMNALQSTLLGAVFIQQKVWFPYTFYDLDTLSNLFSHIILNGDELLGFFTSTWPGSFCRRLLVRQLLFREKRFPLRWTHFQLRGVRLLYLHGSWHYLQFASGAGGFLFPALPYFSSEQKTGFENVRLLRVLPGKCFCLPPH